MPSPFFTTGPRGLIRSLEGTSNIDDIDAGFLAMATDVETKMANYASGLASALPAAGVDGRVYRETDTGLILLDTGAAWQPLNRRFRANVSGTATLAAGDCATAAPSAVLTLPAASASLAPVEIVANGSVTAATPVTVNGTSIFGPGLSAASTFKLGTPLTAVVLVPIGSTWVMVSGAQDTGWVPLTLPALMSAAAGYYVPAARLTGDRVTLRGGIKYAVANPPSFGPYGTVATAGVFPASTVGVPLSLQSGNTIGGQITTSGAIQSANGSVTAGDIVQLDGLGYSLA